ncbi:hypothetical protein WSK_2826 [Novosphingobium sp. Rr 2-17]|uniref:DUF4328 domain-containing protein n=1 Tax=Novosphingobium sp. Rr 2-17 TaxID=555793 RepID=UPI000269989B|nr:DUF4328 domain-containing protein [Novosphingobium sp. Rr 2-17]EIZ78778.1 hypothetical protein WSK_2826 [Novosphingobium sp. Rr 2-17]
MAEMSFEHGLIVLNGRARAVRALLWGYLALTVALLTSWGTVIAMRIDQDVNAQHPIMLFAGIIAIAYFLLFLVCVVAVCLWVYRAHANLRAAGFEGLEFTPGWAVGWFFVPFAFWFKPFQAMRQLWNASRLSPDGYSAPADPLLTSWWGLWVVGNLFLNVSSRLNGIMSDINVVDLIGYALLGGAAWCLLQIINGVTQAQQAELSATHAFT